MTLPVKFILYFLLCVAGFFCAAAMLVLGLHFGLIRSLPADEHLDRFNLLYTSGGLMVSLPAMLAGIGTFFTDGKTSVFFLILPFAVPFLYCLGVLVYFAGL